MKKNFFKGKLVYCGVFLLLLLTVTALFAPYIACHDPLHTDLLHRLKPPDSNYPLGTDQLGRCVFSRIVHGARYTLLASILVSLGALAIGLLAGLFSAMGQGIATDFINLLLDIFLAFPGLILALAITGVLGPGLTSLSLGLIGVGWAWWGRFIRSLTLSAKSQRYVLAGMVSGVSGLRLIRNYILPRVVPSVLVAASFKTGWMLLAISGLSYLGLGAQAPTPEWGAMLKESRLFMTRAPWLMLAPGCAVCLTVLGFNLLAEGLRDNLQVRQANVL